MNSIIIKLIPFIIIVNNKVINKISQTREDNNRIIKFIITENFVV